MVLLLWLSIQTLLDREYMMSSHPSLDKFLQGKHRPEQLMVGSKFRQDRLCMLPLLLLNDIRWHKPLEGWCCQYSHSLRGNFGTRPNQGLISHQQHKRSLLPCSHTQSLHHMVHMLLHQRLSRIHLGIDWAWNIYWCTGTRPGMDHKSLAYQSSTCHRHTQHWLLGWRD